MLDNIGLEYPCSIKDFDQSPWIPQRRGNLYWFSRQVHLDNSAPILYLYYPYVLAGLPLLKVEFSLPHVLYGNNAIMIYNIEQAIDEANKISKAIPGIPILNLWEGRLYRLDICYNHLVGDNVPFYIGALSHLKYPRRKTIVYGEEGIQFYSKGASAKFYSKFLESHNPQDYGILRQESTLRKIAIKRLTGKKVSTLRDLSIEFLCDVLEIDLHAVEVNRRSIGNRDTTIEHLRQKFGKLESIFYYGLLMLMSAYPSREALAASSGYHPRSIERHLQRVADNGIPPTISLTAEELPPLTIDRDQVRRMEDKWLMSQKNG